MDKPYVLALDIGTTSAKAVIFDMTGVVINQAERKITSYYPQDDWVEQDPVEIELACVLAIQEAVSKTDIPSSEIIGMGLSCAMHSLICVDENFKPLSRAMIWADGRSSKQVEELKKTDGYSFYRRTGVPIHPMSPFTKLLWMKENRFEPYEEATYFISVKEYVLYQWFNRRVIDYGMASATGLFNIHTFDWDADALEASGVSQNHLSQLVPPTEILTNMNTEIAQQMNISETMPVIIGSADGQLANLGSGAIAPGEVAISAGTSGAIRQMSPHFDVSDDEETFCYAFTDDLSIIGGPTNNGGIALQWLKELIHYEGSFDALTEEAKHVEPGAEGLLFHPYINGERAPLWNQHAKGNFFGLSITHKKEHLVRAVLEGITYNLYHIGQALESQAGPSEKIYVNGGLAQSDVWVQILADVFNKPVHVPKTHHSPAWGAAWTALVALEIVDSFEQIKDNIPIERIIEPNETNHKIYADKFQVYKQLSKNLTRYF